jgi:hypothetical protein
VFGGHQDVGQRKLMAAKLRTLVTLAFCAVAVAASASALSEELVTIGVNERGLVLVDKDSLSSVGTTNRIRAYEVNPNTDGATGDGLAYVERFIEMDCKQARYRDIDRRYVSSVGALVGERKGAADWDFGIPGSYSAEILKMVCNDSFDPGASLKGQSLKAVIMAYRRASRGPLTEPRP